MIIFISCPDKSWNKFGERFDIYLGYSTSKKEKDFEERGWET